MYFLFIVMYKNEINRNFRDQNYQIKNIFDKFLISFFINFEINKEMNFILKIVL